MRADRGRALNRKSPSPVSPCGRFTLFPKGRGIEAIPDLFFRSNSRNLRIILRHLDKHHPATRTIEGEAVRLD